MFALILNLLGLNCFNVLYIIFLPSKLIAKSILDHQNGHKKSKQRRPSFLIIIYKYGSPEFVDRYNPRAIRARQIINLCCTRNNGKRQGSSGIFLIVWLNGLVANITRKKWWGLTNVSFWVKFDEFKKEGLT